VQREVDVALRHRRADAEPVARTSASTTSALRIAWDGSDIRPERLCHDDVSARIYRTGGSMNSQYWTIAIGAARADKYPLMIFLAGVAACGWLVLRSAPRLIGVLFLTTICFVPIWLGANFIIYFSPVTIVGLVALAAILPALPHRIGPADYAITFLILACLIPILSGGATKQTVTDVLFQWLLALTIGRLLPLKVPLDWLYRFMSMIFGLVSLLAILEFLAGFNPFVKLARPNPLYQTWGTLQERGGIIRAEGAFGHSIALGSSVAMVIPIALASSLRPRTKTIVVGLMLGASIVSFSRTAMIGAVLGIVLSVLFLREGLGARMRAFVVVTTAAVAAVVIPFISAVFTLAGGEATGSADFRGRLRSLIPDMTVLGVSPVVHRTATGELYVGNFKSVDNALILLGLTYGWIAVLLAVLLLGGAIVVVLARRATAPTIAIVAQIPAFATVALITQYGPFVWFMGGLALYTQAERLRADHQMPQDEPEQLPAVQMVA